MPEETLKSIKIIYEDKDILVIDKPAGIVVTSEGVVKGKTIQDWMQTYVPESKLIERYGVVHRLDKGTSGVMVLAKTERAATDLKRQFKERKTKKKYWALVGGDVSCNGEIKVPIKRSKYVFGRWGVDVDGKEAWTLFRLISKYKRNGKTYSLVEIDLRTGRTHQIRVHFSYLRWPLVGDSTYGGERLIDRPFLHARYLDFNHPSTGEKVFFESELAVDLINELKNYEKA